MANMRIRLRRGTAAQIASYASSAKAGELLLATDTGNLYECITDGSVQLIPSSGTITVDQTYNSSSANAQSGVAIAGAGFASNSDLTSLTTRVTALETEIDGGVIS